jgi:hypothetical protein
MAFDDIISLSLIHEVHHVVSYVHILDFNFGWKHTMPPKNCNHIKKNMHLIFWGTCRHHILDYFCSFQVYCIKFGLKLFYLRINFNKKLQTWTYEVYLCQKNTHHKVWKITNILQNQGYGRSVVMIILVVSDIDAHQLNLKPFRSLRILVENSFKNVFFYTS